MKKRITFLTIVATMILIINCGLISVCADNTADYEKATLITEAELSNGVVFDKPYKMTPAKDTVIAITEYHADVEVLERGENDTWSNVWPSFSRYASSLYSLKSGKEYLLILDYYSSGTVTSIKEVEPEVIETLPDANGVHLDKPYYKMTPTKNMVISKVEAWNDVSILERGENDTWSGVGSCHYQGMDCFYWLESGKEYWFITDSGSSDDLIKGVEVIETPLDANGVQFDKPYKMTPTKDTNIAITWGNTVTVLKRGEDGKFTSVKDDFYDSGWLFYSLKANTDYLF